MLNIKRPHVIREQMDPVPLPGEVIKVESVKLPDGVVRQFATGATRDVDTNKLDYEGFLSPAVLEAFAQYMHFNRRLRDGSMRASDNWQKGIPVPVYRSSLTRHFMEAWRLYRSPNSTPEERVWALAAIMFNVQGLMHEELKDVPSAMETARLSHEARREREWADGNLASS